MNLLQPFSQCDADQSLRKKIVTARGTPAIDPHHGNAATSPAEETEDTGVEPRNRSVYSDRKCSLSIQGF